MLLTPSGSLKKSKTKFLKVPRYKWNHSCPQSMGWSKNGSKRELYRTTILPQETRKISDKQPNLYLKQLKKKEQTKPKLVQGKK